MTAVLTVIGDLVEDIVVWTTAPSRRGTDNPATITRSRGGSAANVAAKAAAKTPTRFVGRVGHDPAGVWLVTALDAVGVDVRVQRTRYPDRAAAAELAPIEHEWLTGTTVLHVPAYGFATDPAAGSILGAIEYVRRRGARLSIDVSAVTLIEEFGRDGFSELLDRLAPEVVLANAEEATALGLLDHPPSPGCVVVVKDGPRPAVVMLDDGSRHEVAAVAVTEVRDTTGAGDAFAAGFLATWIRDADPITACAAGHLVAATVLTSVGSG